ncbi:IclR family transcriptional regulator [Halorubrum trueperi]|uniref:IclR family transcriptional regulator n=1 Tax=Halorubrum trueperi TaxID=2004704 RepID=A0ABD5UKU7_9EURY
MDGFPNRTNVTSDTNRIKSIERAFNIVETISDRGSVGVTEVARDLNIPKSSVHVYLNTLANAGYVIKDGSEYRLGHRFLQIGGRLRSQQELFQVAAPLLRSLARDTGELADLMIEEGGWGVLLFKAETADSVDDNAHIGQHVYLHSTAMGKAILSTFSDEKIRNIIERCGIPELTPSTISGLDELFDELETISKTGLSFNNEERRRGVKAVGTPILSDTNELVGAISVSGPSARMTDERMENELADKLLETKNIIELKIDYH